MNERVILSGIECEVMQCGVCGTVHAVAAAIVDHRRKQGGYWKCPNDHSWGYREGTKEKDEVRMERDRLKQQMARVEEEKADLAAVARTAVKNLERHKKRAAAGTCPCCKRTFSNMTRHMKTEHPDFNVVPLKAVRT